MCPPTSRQVLDLPSSVVVTAPSPSERPASAYKAAVDHFVQSDSSSSSSSSSSLTPQRQEDTSFPDVQESHTQLLQQLIGCAKTLTAREDLLNTLRSDRGRMISVSLRLQYLTAICLDSASVFNFKFKFIWDNTPLSSIVLTCTMKP